MNVTINFHVDDAFVETYRSWRDEGGSTYTGSGGSDPAPSDDEDNDDDEEEPNSPDDEPIISIPEEPEASLPEQPEEKPQEETPATDIPATGDLSVLWLVLTAVSGSGLAAVLR